MNINPNIPRSILCVCLGNICRSPTAEAMLRKKIDAMKLDIHVDSAGTSAHHIGESPDSRSQTHAKKRGLDLSNIRSRQVTEQDFYSFDLLLAMDMLNLKALQTMQKHILTKLEEQGLSTKTVGTVALFSQYDAKNPNQPLPDPYYGGNDGFEQVLNQCESSVNGWLNHWQTNNNYRILRS